MQREEIVVRLEVICGIFWLFSDGSWLLEFQTINILCGLCAVAVAFALFFFEERALIPMLVNAAGFSWLLMGVSWAISDLADPKIEWMLFAAKVFFFLAVGLMVTALWNCKTRKDAFALVLRRIKLIRQIRIAS